MQAKIPQWRKALQFRAPDAAACGSPAAVLVPLFEKKGRLHTLLIRRSRTVSRHRGEIAFAGGTHDEGDADLLATALREAREELGLEPADVTPVGPLPDVSTRVTNFRITPYVAAIPYPYAFRLNDAEIDGLIELPLDAVRPADLDVGGRRMPAYRYRRHVIWGATARILAVLLELLGAGASHVA